LGINYEVDLPKNEVKKLFLFVSCQSYNITINMNLHGLFLFNNVTCVTDDHKINKNKKKVQKCTLIGIDNSTSNFYSEFL
jgi:hypothetical protein